MGLTSTNRNFLTIVLLGAVSCWHEDPRHSFQDARIVEPKGEIRNRMNCVVPFVSLGRHDVTQSVCHENYSRSVKPSMHACLQLRGGMGDREDEESPRDAAMFRRTVSSLMNRKPVPKGLGKSIPLGSKRQGPLRPGSQRKMVLQPAGAVPRPGAKTQLHPDMFRPDRHRLIDKPVLSGPAKVVAMANTAKNTILPTMLRKRLSTMNGLFGMLQECQTSEEVFLCLLKSRRLGVAKLDSATLALALHRVADSVHGGLEKEKLRKDPRLLSLVDDISRHLKVKGASVKGRHISMLAWAISRMGCGPDHDALTKVLRRIRKEIARRQSLASLRLGHLSNLVWAFAITRTKAPEIFQAVEHHIKKLARNATSGGISELRDGELVQLVRAFSKVRRHNSSVLPLLADEALRRGLASMTFQHMIKLLVTYGHARLTQQDVGYEAALRLLAAGEIQVQRRSLREKFSVMDAASIVRAYDLIGMTNSSVYDVAERLVVRGKKLLSGKVLVDLVCTFVKAGRGSPDFFSWVGWCVAEGRGGKVAALLGDNDVCLLAESFARARHKDEAVMNRLALEGAARAKRMTIPNMRRLCWACAQIDHPSSLLFKAVAAAVVSKGTYSANNWDIMILCWSFAASSQPAATMFQALKAKVASGKWSPKEACTLAWAYARQGHMSDAISNMALRCLHQGGGVSSLDARDVSKLAFALAVQGQRHVELYAQMSTRLTLKDVNRMHNRELSQMAWSFARGAGQEAAGVLALITKELWQRGTGTLLPSEVGNIAWALAVVQQEGDQHVADALAHTASTMLDKMALPTLRQVGVMVLARGMAQEDDGVNAGDVLEAVQNEADKDQESGAAEQDVPQAVHKARKRVSEELRALHVQYTCGQIVCRGVFIADVVISSDEAHRHGFATEGRSIVIELEGPAHFDGNNGRSVSAELKMRVLRAEGYDVVPLLLEEWVSSKGGGDKAQRLERALQDAARAHVNDVDIE